MFYNISYFVFLTELINSVTNVEYLAIVMERETTAALELLNLLSTNACKNIPFNVRN